jgi:hypothetical protein
MIYIAEFVSVLIAIATIVTVIAIIVVAVAFAAGEFDVNSVAIVLAAVVTTAI